MNAENLQKSLFADLEAATPRTGQFKNGSINKLHPADRPFHDWYRFVLSYPPHLVRHYMEDFELKQGDTLLDPFCGTGTTLVEGKYHRLHVFGVEANPVAHFAASVKTDWSVDPTVMLEDCRAIASDVKKILNEQKINDNVDCSNRQTQIKLESLPSASESILLTDSISPLPLHKSLVLLKEIRKKREKSYYNHTLLALAKTLVYKASNLKFGPEVGVGKIKSDAPVILLWLQEIRNMVQDLKKLKSYEFLKSTVHLSDARYMSQVIEPNSVDAVITSPPYPNEKDYTRTTRLESVILGFINNKEELRAFKKSLVRSNTRGVYIADDDDQVVEKFPDILDIAERIENRRIELGKTSGFERTYARVTKLYFGGMYRHLETLSTLLKPGAQLAYVVGDQASYLRVMIRTGKILAQIAESLGYEHIRTDLFRTRLATATGEQLREEVVILEWRGQ